MLRSQYDTDCITWSPQGRLFQVEYAMEAVKQGSLCLALRSKTHVVLATLNRTPSPLADYQQKIYEVDQHMGLAFAGLTGDGRLICKYMRNEALNHQYAFGSPINPGRLIAQLSEKSQIKTQRSGKRPFGVGCLIAGVDVNGPHIYETQPDANFYEYYAIAIGARSQAAKTYLEKNYLGFSEESLEQLLLHAVKAVKATVQQDTELNGKSVSVAYVGVGQPFKYVSDQEVENMLRTLKGAEEAMEVEA